MFQTGGSNKHIFLQATAGETPANSKFSQLLLIAQSKVLDWCLKPAGAGSSSLVPCTSEGWTLCNEITLTPHGLKEHEVESKQMSLLCLLAVYGRVDVQFIKSALVKSGAGKHPLHGEPHLAPGCCFHCPGTHLSAQLKRAELLLPGVSNQCISPKDSFWARVATLLHRGVYTEV